MTGRADYLAARLAEDRQVAEGLMFACLQPGRRPVFDFCGGPAAEQFWARFDPARMLREIEAKQETLRLHRECGSGAGYCDDGGHGYDLGDGERGCADLAAAVSVYSGRSDFPRMWLPGQ
jgi:hypothetical protein